MEVQNASGLENGRHFEGGGSTAQEQRSKRSDQGREALKDIGFGSLAGIAGKYVEYPFDTVKVRLQSQPDHLALQYRGPLDCFRQSLRQHGFLGFYRGISAPLTGAALETSSLFFSYRVFQQLCQIHVLPGIDPLPLGALVACGALSGAVTSLLLTPIELVKCKVQVPQQMGRPSIRTIVASVYRHEGLRGFWRGQTGTLLRETGGSAAWFGSYEGICSALRGLRPPPPRTPSHDLAPTTASQKQPLPIPQQMLAGAVAGMSYNFAFYPADTIKSVMQTEDVVATGKTGPAAARQTFWSVGRLIWTRHGLRGLYRGCGITVARAAPSSALIFSIYETLRSKFA